MNPRLKEVMDAVNKANPGSMARAVDAKSAYIRRIPSGIFSVDREIGGGIPRGRTTLIVGSEGAGKSTLCLYIAKTWQHTCRQCSTQFVVETKDKLNKKTGEITGTERVTTKDCKCGKNEPCTVAYYDAEVSFDAAWAQSIGVNTDDLLLIQPEGAEQGIDIVSKMLRTGELDLVIIDSIAMMTPRREIENSSEAGQRPDLALAMNKAMRVWGAAQGSLGMMHEQKPAIIMVNQFREKIGVMHGDNRTMTGGNGQRYAASITLFMRPGKKIDKKGVPGGTDKTKVGVEIFFTVDKNKTATPFAQGNFVLYTREDPALGVVPGQVNNLDQILDYGKALGVLERAGATYNLQEKFGPTFANPESPKGAFLGIGAVKEFLRTRPEQAQVIREAILSHVGVATMTAEDAA